MKNNSKNFYWTYLESRFQLKVTPRDKSIKPKTKIIKSKQDIDKAIDDLASDFKTTCPDDDRARIRDLVHAHFGNDSTESFPPAGVVLPQWYYKETDVDRINKALNLGIETLNVIEQLATDKILEGTHDDVTQQFTDKIQRLHEDIELIRKTTEQCAEDHYKAQLAA
jgi:hypothetical protein